MKLWKKEQLEKPAEKTGQNYAGERCVKEKN